MGHMSTPVGWGVSTKFMKIVIKDFNLSFRSSGEVSAQLAATLADQMKIGVLKKMVQSKKEHFKKIFILFTRFNSCSFRTFSVKFPPNSNKKRLYFCSKFSYHQEMT